MKCKNQVIFNFHFIVHRALDWQDVTLFRALHPSPHHVASSSLGSPCFCGWNHCLCPQCHWAGQKVRGRSCASARDHGQGASTLPGDLQGQADHLRGNVALCAWSMQGESSSDGLAVTIEVVQKNGLVFRKRSCQVRMVWHGKMVEYF